MIKEKQTRNNTIDIMRGIAIIMVFLVHYGQTFGNPLFTRFGQMGCQMFFFISGYTCSHSLEKSKSIGVFYKKRYLSIAPGFYTALIIIFAINVLSKSIFNSSFVGGGNTEILGLVSNLLLAHGLLPAWNNTVFPGGWFIGTLAILYLLHPIVDNLFRMNKWINITICGITIVSSCLSIFLNFALCRTIRIWNNSFSYFLFTNQLCCYLLGMKAYYNERTKIDNNIKKPAIYVIVYILLTIGVFYLECLFDPSNPSDGILAHFSYYLWTFEFVLTPIIFGLFCYYFYFLLSRIIYENKKIDSIGKIGSASFYIYLTHTIVVWPIAEMMRNILQKCGLQNERINMLVLFAPCALLVLLLSKILRGIVQKERQILMLEIR